jgi:hypothetical protein
MTLGEILDSLPPGWESLGREAWAIVQNYNPPVEI